MLYNTFCSIFLVEDFKDTTYFNFKSFKLKEDLIQTTFYSFFKKNKYKESFSLLRNKVKNLYLNELIFECCAILIIEIKFINLNLVVFSKR